MNPVLKIKVLPKPVIKGKMDVRFPASVTVESPIILDRTGANFRFGLDLNALSGYFLSSTAVIPSVLLPTPTSITLGGVKSLAAVSHKFLTSIGTDGTPTQAQPAFTDVSGTVAAATQISGQVPLANGGTGQATAPGGFDALSPTTTRGDIIFRNATTNARLAAGTAGYLLQANGAGADPSYAGFLQSGTSAVTRTWQDKARDFVSVFDFMTPAQISDVQNRAITLDVSAAVQAAFTASRCIYFPPGKYKLSSSLAKTMAAGIDSFTIIGAGPDNTVLYWPNTNGGISVTYTGSLDNSVTFSDFSCVTGQANNGAAINLFNPTSIISPAGAAQNNISRVTCRGEGGYNVSTNSWSIGLALNNVSNVNVDTFYVSGPTLTTRVGNGITMGGLAASSTYAVVLNVSRSIFNNLALGIFYGDFVQGVTVDQTNFTGCISSIVSAGGATGLEQLTVTNCQIAPASSGGAGIQVNTMIAQVMIANNLFIVQASSVKAINIVAADQFIISGNQIASITASGTVGIEIAGTSPGTSGIITANQILGFATGVKLDSTSANVAVHSNTFTNNTANITDAGSGNTLRDNIGYNPVGVDGPTPPASGGTFTNGSSPATCYVAATGAIGQILLNGAGFPAGVAAGTVVTLELGPHETFVPTYSGTMSITRSVH